MQQIKFDKTQRYKSKSGKLYGKGVWYRDSNNNGTYDAGDILIRLGNRIKNSDGSYVQLNSDGSKSVLFKNGKASKGVSDVDKQAMANGLIYGTKATQSGNKFFRINYGNRTWDIDTNRTKQNGNYVDSNGNYIKDNKVFLGSTNKQLIPPPISRFTALTKKVLPIRDGAGTVMQELDRSKLDSSQYNLINGKLYDTQGRIVGVEKNNKLYGYGYANIPDSVIAENSDYIGKYAYNLGDERAKAVKNGQYVNYWTGNVLNEYNKDLNNLPKGIEGDRQGNLYYPNGKPYGRIVKHTDGSSGFYKFSKFLSEYKLGGKTIDNYSNKFKFGGTMKLIAKAQKGMSFKEAFNKARNNGDRIFWYKGKTYNTMTSKEQNNSKLRQQWAKTHKDNSTSGGSNNVQTDIGLSGGWEGIKGANAGRFDDNGNWIRLTKHSDAPVAVRGNNVTQYLDYAPIDKPTDKISTYTPGTDRNQFSTNETTGLIVGNPYMVSNPKKVEYNSFMWNRQYGGNEDITQFSPWGFPGSPGTYVVSPITPGYSLERSPELVPPQVSFEPQTPEQIEEFAKTIGIDPKYISGDRQITVTAKRKK